MVADAAITFAARSASGAFREAPHVHGGFVGDRSANDLKGRARPARGSPRRRSRALFPKETGAPMCLVCVHGRRDRCCALHGSAVFRAVQAHGVDVWQTSHLGGHRFAACALWLPDGLMYGRLRAEDAGAFVAARQAGEIGELSSFRGRCGYDRPTQAAEIFLRKRLGEQAAGAVEWLTTVAGTRVDLGGAVSIGIRRPSGSRPTRRHRRHPSGKLRRRPRASDALRGVVGAVRVSLPCNVVGRGSVREPASASASASASERPRFLGNLLGLGHVPLGDSRQWARNGVWNSGCSRCGLFLAPRFCSRTS